jgi:hypothetical protein
MNLFCNKILGTGLALGLAALNLSAQSAAQFGNLPLRFEAGTPAKFIAHASGAEFAVSPAGAEFTLAKNDGQLASCQMQIIGASPAARITGDQPLATTINYLLGNQPGLWRTGVPTFAQVRVENVYPGVNVVYYGNRQKLEYDFDLAAGVNPAVIALHFAGAEKVSVNQQGELVIRFASGEVVQHTPVAYQTVGDTRQEIAAGYKILDAHTATFALGNYNHAEPLVIDPVLRFSSYFGGDKGDTGMAIAVNPTDRSIYVAGQTFSSKDTNNSPATFSTPGAFQTNYHGGRLTGDAFVARFTNDIAGNPHLLYVTYLGGSGNDGALGLAVDTNGYAFVTGFTDSTDFPTTNALYSHVGGGVDKYAKSHLTDAFVAELNTNGDKLIYSTYLGGSSMDAAYGIALDEADNAYVTGYTYSTDFPVTPNTAFRTNLQCPNSFYINANAFVAEISASGTNLNYSTYLGGTNIDEGRAIAYKNGRVFVAGYTCSTNFPMVHPLAGLDRLDGRTNAPLYKKTLLLTPDVFVTAFTCSVTNLTNPTVLTVSNLTLLYSTYLGGSNYDMATGIAADANGSAYVCGYTSSMNFTNTATNYLSYGYMAVTNRLLHTMTAETAVNTNGFLTRIDWNATNTTTSIGYSALFGGHGTGKGVDVANGVAIDPAGNAYVVGTTTSTNFPVVTDNLSTNLTATLHKRIGWPRSSDVFVIAFGANGTNLLYSAYLGGDGSDFGNAIAVYSYSTTNGTTIGTTTNGTTISITISTTISNVCNAYITGQTLSTNFPAVSALQSHRNGSNDMFIAVIQTVSTNIIISTNTVSGNIVTRTVPELVIVPENISVTSVQSKVAGSPLSPPPGISLKWQASLTDSNYDVEGSTDLTAGSWHTVAASFTYSNGCYHVTLPTTNGIQFFRLATTNIVQRRP